MLPDLPARLRARVPQAADRRLMHQRWESLLFLHWRCSPALIQETLPRGLSVDTFGGNAYLGVVPFFMRHVRPFWGPSLPWLSFFQELNVRTYVFDEAGVPGVWFYSLDCNQPLAVWAARWLFGLPYFHAKMLARRSEWTDYSSTRRGTSEAARFRYRGVGTAREADAESLEFFLLERYFLYAKHPSLGALLRGRVSHRPYRYRVAEVEEFSTVPAQLDGFRQLGDATPDHACLDEGFEVTIHQPHSVCSR